MKRIPLMSYLLFSGLAGSVIAQSIPIIEPKCFVWGEPYNWSASERYLVRVFQPHTFYNIYLDPAGNAPLGWYNLQEDAGKAAEWCIQQIQASGLNPGQGKIAIIIAGLGIESAACDPGQPSYVNGGPTAQTRFFRVDDALNIPSGAYDYDASEARSDKPYKHPLLINGGTRKDANGQPIPSVLRQWVVDFCVAYKNLQQLPVYAGVPDPERFILDAEPQICPVPGRNPVVTFRGLSESPWWSTVDVPGYPAGTTMASLWTAAGYTGTVIDNTSDSRNPLRGAGHPLNRNAMRWYVEVTRRAQDGILDHAVWSVIRQYFPNTKYGNYDDVNTDGVVDSTGWMQDWNSQNAVGPYSAVETFPRLNMDKAAGGPMWNTPTGRWLGLKQRATGQMESPFLYYFGPKGLDGDSDWNIFPGHRQVQLYKTPPGGPEVFETDVECELRVNRHTAEATIESAGGQPGRVFAPWVNMAYEDNVGTPDHFAQRELVRRTMSMLRAKNVEELVFWTSHGIDSGYLSTAWNMTRECVRRAYAARIQTYTNLAPVPIGGTAPAVDVSKLEFTTRTDTSSGVPKAYELEVMPVVSITGPLSNRRYQGTSTLVVDFTWEDSDVINSSTINVMDDFEVNIESSVTSANPGPSGADIDGKVYFWSGASGTSGQWVSATGTAPDYKFYAPVSSDGRTRVRSTLQFSDPQNITGAICWDSTIGKYKSRLKLVHRTASLTSTANIMTRSWYDLVQLVPLSAIAISVQTSAVQSGAQGFANSDVNMDGVVDGADLTQFIDEWIEQTPNADMDFNNNIELEDIESFEEFFVTGT